MSKYIIDTNNYYLHEFDGALIVMMHDGKPVSLYESKDNLEELNSDYINEHFGELQDEAYQKGLNDAWEAARRIIHMPEGDLLNIFTECYSAVCTALQVLLKYDASEVIEKLKAYEEKQKADDEITVGVHFGDEIVVNGERGVIVSHENEGSDTIWALLNGYRTPQIVHKNNYTKTGRRFDMAGIMEAVKNG